MSGEDLTAAQERLIAWAGCVRRLVMVAPVSAVIDETGITHRGHSTPPERQAIREEALRTVGRWLARDLAALDPSPPAKGDAEARP